MHAMVTVSCSSVDDFLAALASGYGVSAGPLHPDCDVLSRTLRSARRAALHRPLDAEFQVAALCVGLLDLSLGCIDRRDPNGPTVDVIRDLFGRRTADLVALYPSAVAYRAILTSDDDEGDDLRHLISPARLRRLRRHRCFAEVMALASMVETAAVTDPLAPVPSLLSFRPTLEAVAAATARERDVAMYSLQLLAIPR